MRFHLGAIPETPEFSPDAGWKPLREPTVWMAQLMAWPLGLAAAVAVGVLWVFLTPLDGVLFDLALLSSLAFLAVMPAHELIHAAVHPQAGLSGRSILGFWPSRLLLYAHYTGELSRGRFIAILLMPLLVISLLPLLVCMAAGWSSPFFASASIWNALMACMDMLGTGLLLFQVPSGATVRNQGWQTFWKAPTAKIS